MNGNVNPASKDTAGGMRSHKALERTQQSKEAVGSLAHALSCGLLHLQLEMESLLAAGAYYGICI